MLFAIALPPVGGNTIFASMYAACDALPADLRQKLEGRLAMHSYEPGYGTSNVQMRIRAPVSPTAHSFAHPVIRTHAATGRKALYVNRLMTQYIVGMRARRAMRCSSACSITRSSRGSSTSTAGRSAICSSGTNRCALHARRDFPATHLRKLRRVAVKGERPV